MLARAVVLGVLAPLLALVPSAARADSVSECTGQDKVILKEVKLKRTPFRITHAEQKDIPAGAAFKRTYTVSHTRTLSAKATGAVEISGGADWKIYKLDAKVSYSLELAGSLTDTTSVSDEFSLPKRKKQKLWVLYVGHRQPVGRWHWIKCSRAPGVGTEKWGKVLSWATVERSGAIRCKRSLYKTGSIRHQVATQAGCPK